MSVWLIVLLSMVGYLVGVVGTYVIQYPRIYRQRVIEHKEGRCGCSCTQLRASSLFTFEHADYVPADYNEWISERRSTFHREMAEEQRRWIEQAQKLIAREKGRLSRQETPHFARTGATMYAILWPVCLLVFLLRYVLRQLGRAGRTLLTHPLQHLAEAPLRNEELREAKRQEAAALRKRFDRDIENGE